MEAQVPGRRNSGNCSGSFGDGSTELNRRASGFHSALGITLLHDSEPGLAPTELLAVTVKV
jgi:hypothetical protein